MSVEVTIQNPVVVVQEVSGGYEVSVSASNQVVEVNVNGSIPIPIATGGSADWVVGETPAGDIDGVNDTFTTAFDFAAGKLVLFLNGLRLDPDYYSAANGIIIIDDPPEPGDKLKTDYIKL